MSEPVEDGMTVEAALVTMLAMLVCGSDKVTLASFVYNTTPATVVASVLFGAFA